MTIPTLTFVEDRALKLVKLKGQKLYHGKCVGPLKSLLAWGHGTLLLAFLALIQPCIYLWVNRTKN